MKKAPDMHPLSSDMADTTYRQMFFSHPIPMWVYDLQTGRFLEVNEAAVRNYGYSKKEFLAMTVGDIVSGADAPLLQPEQTRAWAEETAAETRELQLFSIYCRQRLKDGRYIDAETVLHPIEFDGHTAALAFVEDRTKRKRAEAALNESEKRFRTLFTHMTEGVALHEMIYDEHGADADYRILEVNPAYSRQTGLVINDGQQYRATELYGTKIPPYLKEFGGVASSGEPYMFETYFAPLEKHFRIIVISPKPGTFATVFEDITERKKKEEELLQKNEEMERFTYTVSHDLKSPLVTVRTFLGFLEQDMKSGDEATIEKDIRFIRTAITKMSTLLDELLNLSRVGRKMNMFVEMSLQSVVHEAFELVAGRLAARNPSVTITEVPVMLYGDRARLLEIFQNLIDNAVKFMGNQAAPHIEVGIEPSGEEIVIFVRDNGIGIDPRHKSKLFGMFEKLNPGTEGTGMGLALVRRIVEVHGGKIWADSDGPGSGTTFRLTLAKTKFHHPNTEQ